MTSKGYLTYRLQHGSKGIARESKSRLIATSVFTLQTAIVRNTLRNDLGLRIVEVNNEKAQLDGTDVLFTGKSPHAQEDMR